MWKDKYTRGLKTIPSTNSTPDLISIVNNEMNTTEEIRWHKRKWGWQHLNKKNFFFHFCLKWNEEDSVRILGRRKNKISRRVLGLLRFNSSSSGFQQYNDCSPKQNDLSAISDFNLCQLYKKTRAAPLTEDVPTPNHLDLLRMRRNVQFYFHCSISELFRLNGSLRFSKILQFPHFLQIFVPFEL